MVFFRSVSFTELESLVDYIYKGRTQVAGSSVQAFLSLANSLGVSGFTEEEEEGSYKENIQLSSNSVVTTPLSKVVSPLTALSMLIFTIVSPCRAPVFPPVLMSPRRAGAPARRGNCSARAWTRRSVKTRVTTSNLSMETSPSPANLYTVTCPRCLLPAT